MSETLRDLVVSLSLNSDNFTRNIKSINKQIQEAQSEFRMMSSTVDNFESTVDGLSTKLNTLQRIFTLQEAAVGQYERALAKAKDKLQECYDREADYAARLDKAREKQEGAAKAVSAADAAYRNYKASLGEANSATIAAGANLEAAKREYVETSAEVAKLEGQHAALVKATQNAADAVSTATVKLNDAQTALNRTQSELDATAQALQLAQTQWDAAGASIKTAESTLVSIGKQIKTAESRFRLAAAGIKEFDKSAEGLSAKLVLLKEKLDLQQKAVAQYETALKGAKEQLEAAKQANDPEKIKQATDAVESAKAALNDAKAAVRETRSEIDDCNKSLQTAQSRWTAVGNSLGDFSKKCNASAQAMSKAGKFLSTTVTAPIAALGTAAVKASIDFESAFASVRKTVNATEAQFASLEASVKQMSTEVAASTSEIAEVMATGGQLGIATEYLEEFTRVMIDLGNSCEDLDAQEAATTIAQFANVMGTDQSLFKNIGSTIVELGNNFATTEEPIMTMAQRLSGAGKQIGMSEPEILGFSAALSSVGISAEMGGSAFSKALINMEVAVETGGQALTDFANVSGMTEAQFQALWKSNPADAFIAFISGLAQMDDEGISAVATLNDIGISEIRLRDTLLRSVNAVDLFRSALDMADNAWKENTALTAEASKRYSTTASRLTNLKNKAVLVAQAFGDDLNPTIRDLISGASDFLDKLSAMDAADRKTIMRIALIAASIGPVITLISKGNAALGALSGGISKFALTAANAGGGVSGLWVAVKALLGPVGIAALAAGLAYGTYKLIDWASGAKAAREAAEGMVDVAERMKETQAETLYDTGTSDPLARFGVYKESFESGANNSKSWFDSLVVAWTDGKKETNETVQSFVDAFTDDSDTVRTAIQNRGELLEGLGTLTPEQQEKMQKDLEQLDSWDAEIAKLLKKRKNGNLTEEDQQRLTEIITLRTELQLEYGGQTAESYEGVLQGLHSEIERTTANGGTVTEDVYGDALNALAAGRQAYIDSLNESYDAQYAQIMLIEDETERTAALMALNQLYNEQRDQNEKEYQAAVKETATEAFENGAYEEQITQFNQLASLIGSGAEPTELLSWAEDIDEGKMASMLALVEQLKASGATDSELAELGIDADTLLSTLEQIRDITSDTEGMEGLAAIFGEAIPEEVQRILVGLDMTEAAADWTAFMEGKDPWTTKAELSEVDDAAVDAWETANADVTITGPAAKIGTTLGAGWQSTLKNKMTLGLLKVYGANGMPLTVTPEVIDQLDENDLVVVGSDGTVHVLVTPNVSTKPTVTVKLNPLDSDAIAEWEKANSRLSLTGPTARVGLGLGANWQGTLKNKMALGLLKVYGADGMPINVTPAVVDQITVNDLVAVEEDGTVHVVITPKVGTKEAAELAQENSEEQRPLFNFFGVDVSTSGTSRAVDTIYQRVHQLKELRAEIDALRESGNEYNEEGESLYDLGDQYTQLMESLEWLRPTIEGLDEVDYTNIGSQIATLYAALESGDLDEETAAQYLQELQKLFEVLAGLDEFLGGTASEPLIEGVAGVLKDYNWDTDAATVVQNLGDAVARMALLYPPKVEVEPEVETVEPEIETPVVAEPVLPEIPVNENANARIEDVKALNEEIGKYQQRIDALKASGEGADADGNTLESLEAAKALLTDDLLTAFMRLGSTDLQGVSDEIAAILSALSSGELDEEQTAAYQQRLEEILSFISAADNYLGTGNYISAGIASGMTAYGWTTDANTVASDIKSAVNAALGVASPATEMMPTGEYVSAGIGEGMKGYDWESTASELSGSLQAVLNANLAGAGVRSVGYHVMTGLALGILKGKSIVTASMRLAARAAVQAAKKELVIQSPSHVFRDEIGAMVMKGFGQGILEESENQAKVIRNASRYLTGEAKEASIGYNTSYDQRRYDQSSSVTLTVGSLNVRSDQDIRDLAVEIAGLTRRQQRGKGMRMA